LINYYDQSLIFNPQTWCYTVSLIGAGGINSTVGPLLAKMGINQIHAWDDDSLNEHNLPTEIGYSAKDVGKLKVVAMANSIQYYIGDLIANREGNTVTYSRNTIGEYPFNYVAHAMKVKSDTLLSGVVISGVDSMKSRTEIWQAVQANCVNIPLYIDARSGGEETTIFAFSPADYQAAGDYETWLFDDSEAKALPCGARNIGYIGSYTTYWIGRIITRFSRELPIEFQRHVNHSLLLGAVE